MIKILFYVSGHGYGHISRSYEIIKELLKDENIHITVVSGRIDFIRDSHPRLEKRKILMDVGIYQKDSISLDIRKTAYALEEFEAHKNDILKNELDYAKAKDYDLILSDSASLPFVLGVELRIPAIFIGNFTWDFIYRNYKKENPYFGVIAHIMEVEYSFATAAIQLPFSCPMKGFLETYQVGLVGRKPTLGKAAARNHFGMRDDDIHFLLSFGAYGLEGVHWNWSNKPSNWRVYTSGTSGVGDESVTALEADHYPNLVTAVDYVITKPGYGIISECIYADTPILYTDRGDFAEYPILAKELDSTITSSYISQEDLLNLNWNESIHNIRMRKESNTLWAGSLDGVGQVSQILRNYYTI